MELGVSYEPYLAFKDVENELAVFGGFCHRLWIFEREMARTPSAFLAS